MGRSPARNSRLYFLTSLVCHTCHTQHSRHFMTSLTGPLVTAIQTKLHPAFSHTCVQDAFLVWKRGDAKVAWRSSAARCDLPFAKMTLSGQGPRKIVASKSVALSVLPLAHHLTECHAPHVEEGPGDGEQGQGQHGNDADIEALVILIRSACRPSRSWHGGSCQRCAHDNGLLLLLQSRFCSFRGCHEGRRRPAAAQGIGGRSDEQQRRCNGAGASHDLMLLSVDVCRMYGATEPETCNGRIRH